jgi:hypothetical protein
VIKNGIAIYHHSLCGLYTNVKVCDVNVTFIGNNWTDELPVYLELLCLDATDLAFRDVEHSVESGNNHFHCLCLTFGSQCTKYLEWIEHSVYQRVS